MPAHNKPTLHVVSTDAHSAGAVSARSRRKAAATPAAAGEEPDEVRLGWFQDATGFHLRKAQEASFAAFKRLVGGIDIRVGHFATLMLIGENPGISQTALGRAVGRDKSSLTPILDDLVQRGLVVRRRAVQDRRRYGLTLSEAGEVMRGTLEASAAEHERALAACISPDDQAHFVRILKRIERLMPD